MNKEYELRLIDEIAHLRVRVDELEERLEISHVYRMRSGGGFDKVIVPTDRRRTMPDGIDCRDATIALLEEDRDDLIEDMKRQMAIANSEIN